MLPRPRRGDRRRAAAGCCGAAALQHVVQLGFYRGILNQLGAIETAQPECAPFVDTMRAMARQFQFEGMARILSDAGVPQEVPE